RVATSGGLIRKFAEVKLWDAATGKLLAELAGPTDWVEAVTFSPDGRVLASSGGTRGVAAPPRPAGGGVGPPGRERPAPAGGSTVNLWDVELELGRKVLTGHTDTVSCAAFSGDGKLLATGSWDKTIKLWDTSSWELKATLTGHEGHLLSLAFSPDGKHLV